MPRPANITRPPEIPVHPNAALIERLYTAGMQACDHPDIVFSDPAFGGLRIQ